MPERSGQNYLMEVTTQVHSCARSYLSIRVSRVDLPSLSPEATGSGTATELLEALDNKQQEVMLIFVI